MLTALVMIGACQGKSDDSGQPLVGVPLLDANNYNYEGALDLPSVQTVPAADLDICWEEAIQDIQCHDLDPSIDVDNVGLVRFSHLSEEEVEAKLSGAGLQQADISGYVEWINEDSALCTTLADMSFFGTEIDVTEEYVDDGSTYMLLLTEGTEPGVGARVLTFLDPTPESDNTAVDFESGCGVLDLTADVQSLERWVGDDSLVVDWSQLTADGQGLSIDFGMIDKLSIGHYPELEASDLETQFLDIELIAEPLYTMELEGGTVADLSNAKAGSENFSGFNQDGLWMLALQCTRCSNPAPLFLTLVDGVSP